LETVSVLLPRLTAAVLALETDQVECVLAPAALSRDQISGSFDFSRPTQVPGAIFAEETVVLE
jgi:hypothetical protein